MLLGSRLATISIVLGVAAAGTTASVGPVGAAGNAAVADWGRVVNLSAPEGSWSLLPTSSAIDSRGNTLAVWINGGERRVMTAYRPQGGAWRRPVAVPASRGAQFEATVGFDGAGEAVVAWESGHRIRAVRRGSGGAWGKPVTVHRSQATDAEMLGSSLNLTVNERGKAAISFVTRSGLHVVIGSADGRWGKAWTPPRTPEAQRVAGGTLARSASPVASGGADLVIDRWGRITVVWAGGGWLARVKTASKAPGKPWTRPRTLTRLLWDFSHQIGVRPNGEVVVLVHPPVGRNAGLRILRKPRDGGWVRSTPLALGKDPWKHRMAVDGSGRVSVAWSNRGALWRVDHVPGSGWGRKVRVTRPEVAGDDYWLVANDAGHVLFGWTSSRPARAVQAVRRSPSGDWQVHPRTLSEGRGASRGPALAIGPNGAAVVLWTFQPAGSTTSRIQAVFNRVVDNSATPS